MRTCLVLFFLGALVACGDSSPVDQPDASVIADTTSNQDTLEPDVQVEQCGDGVAQLSPCDDGNPCTEDDKCFDGKCVGAQKACDDGNVCTDDSCEVPTGCKHVPNKERVCDDGNMCTSVDSCVDGACVGKPMTLTECDDGNVCTKNDVCEEGKCLGEPHVCNDFNTCTKDFCDPDHPMANELNCVHQAIQVSCDDLDECTENDACIRGECLGDIVVDKPCVDGSLCTDDGKCQEDGSCIGSGKICNDNNPCTLDTCEADDGCLFTPDVDAPCDDGDLCTIIDLCQADGSCTGSTKCLPKTPCEVVECVAETGECITTPKDCNDNNPCTSEECKTNLGCVYTNVTDPCNDGVKCTINDTCQDGLCFGEAKECDPANDTECEANLCNENSGECEATYLDGEPCADGDYCTKEDVCSKGFCVGIPKTCSDGDPCTDDYCVGDTGECVNEEIPTGCEDIAWDRTNVYRDLMGLEPLLNNEHIKNAALAHCKYYVNNYNEVYKGTGLSPHNEAEGYDGFTGVGFGERMASAGFTNDMGWAMFEVMHFIYDEEKSVDEWMASLYHRIPFIVPLAKSMGYGAATKANTSSCDTIDFAGGNGKASYDQMVIPFPVDGMQNVPTWWPGNESPQPPLPPGEVYPSGPIITVTMGSQNAWPSVSLTSSEIFDTDGNTVPHVANDPQSDPDLCCGVVTLYPVKPLDTFTTYTVQVEYSKNNKPGSIEWTFTTGNGDSVHYLD